MPKGYVVVTEDIHDQAGMAAYGQRALPTLAPAGGRLIVLDETPEVIEGNWHGTRTVILEFDSVEAAQGWYCSPEYQDAVGLRLAASDCNAVILSGL